MSTFDCPVVSVHGIAPIEGADRIELVKILGFQVVAAKERFHVGDLAVFIPDGAIIPAELAAAVKGTTKLFGERKNRVRPFYVRDMLSEGLLIGPLHGGVEGSDASAMLGVKKYEQPIPPHMRGACADAGFFIVPYDIQSFRRWPHKLLAGEDVEITEKIHGTFCGVSYIEGLGDKRFLCGDTIVFSKGLGRWGLAFKAGEKNIYMDTAVALRLRDRIRKAFGVNCQATVFGEIFGAGVQDLDYGVGRRFLIFDVYLGSPGDTGHMRGRFLNRDEVAAVAEDLGGRVPVLYRGPFNREKMVELASGPTTTGDAQHFREGVVVTPMRERHRPGLGRVILKYVSSEYLTRRDGTEFQ